MLVRFAAICLAGHLMAFGSAEAQTRRLALVIGNDTYENVTPLQKARNDAKAMAATLKTTDSGLMSRAPYQRPNGCTS